MIIHHIMIWLYVPYIYHHIIPITITTFAISDMNLHPILPSIHSTNDRLASRSIDLPRVAAHDDRIEALHSFDEGILGIGFCHRFIDILHIIWMIYDKNREIYDGE